MGDSSGARLATRREGREGGGREASATGARGWGDRREGRRSCRNCAGRWGGVEREGVEGREFPRNTGAQLRSKSIYESGGSVMITSPVVG